MSKAAGPAQPVSLDIPADAPFFAGHFPGSAIVPGAYLLARTIEAICDALAYDGVVEIASAKFLAMVRPGQAVSLSWEQQQKGSAVSFALTVREVKEETVVSGTLKFSDSPSRIRSS